MKKTILIVPAILLTMNTYAAINSTELKESDKILKSIPGVKITELGGMKNNSSRTQKEQQLKQAQEQANNNILSQPATATPNFNPAAQVPGQSISIPASPNVTKPQIITPQNAPIPVPQSYMDIQSQPQQHNGQTPPEPIKVKPMTLQDWNTSTIKELEERGQENARQNYQNFRRGIQYW